MSLDRAQGSGSYGTSRWVLIASLIGLFFAWHVLWPQGFAGRFEWLAAAVGVRAQDHCDDPLRAPAGGREVSDERVRAAERLDLAVTQHRA